MFDSVLRRRETLPRRRFAAGSAIAIAVHAGIVSLVLYASAVAPERKKVDVAVTFLRPPPPPPPAPRVAPRQARPRPREPPTVLPQAIVAPTVVPQEKPPEQERTPEQQVSEGVEGGEVGGVPGGIVGGVVDSPQARLEFDTRMTPPVYVSGPDPKYTEKAIEQEIEGLMIVKCVVTTGGQVYDCRVVKSLPYMDRAVIDALERRRYRPAMLGGSSVEVDYTFRIRLVLP